MRILIVEDDFISRRLLLAILSHYGSCDAVTNGADALAAYRAAVEEGDPYQLVCLDLMMPVVNGYEVLREMRRFEAARGTTADVRARVIVTTQRDDLDSIARAFGAQCEAYLTKPIDKRKLISKMAELKLIQGQADLGSADIPGEARKRLGDLFSTWERQYTGKGPTGIKVYSDGLVLTVVTDGFMTTLEESLAARDENGAFLSELRTRLLQLERGHIEDVLARELGLFVSELHSHVDTTRNRLIVVIRTSHKP